MKAAVYLRVSTEGQDEASQEPECRRLCEARGWEPVTIRERESAAKVREGWAAVLELARRGEVRAVVFWDLRRIGRTRVQVAHDLDELLRWNVAIASVRNSWLDIAEAGPVRHVLIQLFGWLAEDELDAIKRGTARGIAAARARGVKIGRPQKWTHEQLDRAAELRAQIPPASWSQVAKAVGLKRGTVQVALQRRAGLR